MNNMKSFTSRQFSQLFGVLIRKTKPFHVILMMIGCILILNGFTGFSPVRIAIGAVLGAAIMPLLILIIVFIAVQKNTKVYKVLDEQGFCMEYLRVYERERITNKPFRLDYALEYAEIFMNIGKPDEAIKYLNTLTIPENTNPVFHASYFYVYVRSALKINNLAIAEDMWKRSTALINQISTNPASVANGYLVVLMMIYTDCFAARQNGDKSRLERAFQQTESAMNGEIGKAYAAGGGNAFDIARLYELKALGMTDKYNELFREVKAKIENSNPIFACMKTMELEDLTQIENGELPI